MIILSGVLVVAAIALLVAGIVAGNGDSAQVFGLDALVVIYISIGVSIVSALCLAVGVFLRRKELFGPGVSGGAAKKRKPRREKRDKRAKSAPVPQAAPGPRPAGAPTEPLDDGVEIPVQPVDVPDDALVLVVRGRKRYHIDTCRQLAGRDTEELTYAEAREEGFSPCTACMPDMALAARARADADKPGAEKPGAEKPGAEKPGAEKSSAERSDENGLAGLARPAPHSSPPPLDATAGTARGPEDEGPARTPAGPTLMDLPVADLIGEKNAPEKPEKSEKPAEEEPVEEEPDGPEADEPAATGEKPPEREPSPAPDVTVDLGSADTGAAAPRPRDAGKPEQDEPAAEVPRRTPDPEPAAAEAPAEDHDGDDPVVRILSGTKRYHRTDCALIEDIGDEADDLESLARAEAKARGCTPCLVCQPDRERARD